MIVDQKLKVTIEADIKPFASAMKAAEAQINHFGAKLNSLKASNIGKVGKDFESLGTSGSKAGSLLNAVFGGNLASQAVAKLSSELYEGASAVLSFSSALEQAKIGFETMTGSASLAQDHLKELQDFAKTTPFEFPELVEASQKMQGVGFAAKDIIPILKDVGNALSAAGRLGDMPYAIKALSDIKAKGKLAGQEIIQLANAGIPIRDVLAKSLNKSTAEIVEMGEKGEISADMVFAALHQMSQERFGDAMMKQSRTFQGAMSNIKDSLLITSSEAFKPIYAEASRLAVNIADDINKQGGDFAAVGNVIGQYIVEGITLAVGVGVEKLAESVFAQINDVSYGKVFSGTQVSAMTGTGSGLMRLFGLNEEDVRVFKTAIKEMLSDPLMTEGWEKHAKAVEAEIYKTETAVKSLADTAGSTPSLSELMKTAKSKADTETLNKTISELTIEIANYGDKSKETAVKQKLLKAGISDFTSELAKSAMALARQYDQLEAYRKQSDTLTNTIKELGLKVSFFGDESEVAAVKQSLLSQGVADLNSGLAKSALAWAGRLDDLKKAKKEQDDYNNKLKDLGQELLKVRQDAQFEIRFPKATELDRFNRWVKENASGFSSLKNEIQQTRAELERLQKQSSLRATLDNYAEFTQSGMSELVKGVSVAADKASPLEKSLLDVAKAMHLVRTEIMAVGEQGGIDVTGETFAKKAKEFVEEIGKANDSFATAMKPLDEYFGTDKFTLEISDAMSAAKAKNTEQIDAITKKFTDFLATLKTVDEKGNRISVFTNKTLMKPFIDQLIYLDKTVKASTLTTGLEKLDGIFTDLNLRVGDVGALTNLEKLNNLLAAPDITAAIEARAKALGYTAEQLKEIIRSRAAMADDPRARSTRPRVVGENDKGGFGAGLSGALFGDREVEKFATSAEKMKAVYRDLGATVGDVFASMAGGAQDALANFILTGKGGAEAFASLAASAIASLAVQSGIKAIFEVAEGIKEQALAAASAAVFDVRGAALHQASAAAHFSAATTYGIIGGVAAGAGLAIGAAGGLSGGGGGKNDKNSSNSDSSPFNPYANSAANDKTVFFRQTSDQHFFNPNNATSRLEQRINELSNNVGQLTGIVKTSRPGDVLVRGSGEKPGFIASTNLKELKSNATLTNQTARHLTGT